MATAIADGYYALDSEWRFVAVDSSAEQHLGQSSHELIGRSIWDVTRIPPDSPIYSKFHDAVACQRRVRFETESGIRAGLWFEVHAHPRPTGGLDVYFHEVTERKRVEATLRKSEERLRHALQAANAGNWEWDLRTNENDWSEEIWALYGLDPDGCVPSYDAWLSSVDPSDRERVARTVQDAAANGAELTVEWRVATGNGPGRWLSSRAKPQRDDAGRVTRYVGIVLDITARRQAENALRESLAELQKIFDVETVGLMIWDLTSGCLIGANDTFLNVMGYSRGEVDARELTWQTLTPPEYQEVSRAEVQKFLATGRVGPYEKEYLRKDGSRQWFVFAGSSLGNNMCVEFCVDISDRKKVEAELRRSEEQFRVLTQNLVSGVALVDEHGAFVIVNRSFRRLFDLDENNDILNVNSRDWSQWQVLDESGKPLDVDDHPVRRAALKRVAVKDKLIAVQTPARPDLKWLLVSAEPILDTDGKVHRLICTYHDITARKQAEQALEAANASLREDDRRKNEFIAVLSHELRNPLAPIRYALPILQSQPLDDSAGRALSVIKRQTDQLTRLLDDLLDVGRISNGKLVLQRQQVTLRTIVTAAIEAATPALSAAHHIVNMNVTPERVWLNADPARLGQVLMNLLDNSAKFTPSGGEITLEATREGDQAVIRVRDGGLGIPSELVPHIFEMFRQVHSDPSRGGLGIGLAIARRLVEMHDGTIAAFSAGPGKGAEFVVRLPVAPETKPADRTHVPNGTPLPGRRLKVLVVDDNLDLVEMLSLVVEGAGHEVRKATDGPSGLSTARAYVPDVVLLDLGLPVMSGLEVARELRRDPNTANARLIALTGWGQAEDREKTRAAGFHFHLTKPTEPEEVRQLLEAIAAGAPR